MLEADDAGAVFSLADGDACGIFGEEFFDEFGPLDEAEVAAVDVVVETDVVGFFHPTDAVEVEMVDDGC